MASNPVLRNFEKSGRPGMGAAHAPQGAGAPPVPPPTAGQLNDWYAQPAYAPTPPPNPTQPTDLTQPTKPARYLTVDDVVTRSGVLLLTLLAAAALTWFLVPTSALGAPVLIGTVGALGLGLYIAFSGRANAGTTITYAALEGVALGGISELFDQRWPGIVVQAVTGTIMVAGAVLLVYKTGAVRVTPKFTKIVIAATLGAVGLMLANLVVGIFHSGGLGLRDSHNPGLAIGFSLLCIVIAAANLIVDFDMISQSVRRGVDEQYGWYLSWGILVTLVWLYLEILRLLSYLRGGD